MFAAILERGRDAAERSAAAKREALAQALGDMPGLRAKATAKGVELSGRALKRRFALDPVLRSLAGVLR